MSWAMRLATGPLARLRSAFRAGRGEKGRPVIGHDDRGGAEPPIKLRQSGSCPIVKSSVFMMLLPIHVQCPFGL